MKLVIRETGYAVAALCVLVKHKDRRVSVAELAREMKIPRYFLRKIMQLLSRKGIVNSSKGQGGGFMLARPANKIFLLDLIKIFQGPIKLSECVFKNIVCPNIKRCKLKKIIAGLQKQVIAELKTVRLDSLMEAGS